MPRRLMLSNMLQLGLIGCGGWASNMHIPALAALQEQSQIKVAAVCDLNQELAQQAAGKLGLNTHYQDIDAMLEKEEIQALSILAPVHVTEHLIEKVTKLGIPFLTEKPPATSAQKQAALIDLVGNLPHIVAYNRRFGPYMDIARNWMAGLDLQSVSVAFSRHQRLDEQFSNTFVHGLDAMLSFIGPVTDAQAIINIKDQVTNISLQVLGKNNCIGHLLVTPNNAVSMEHYEIRSASRFTEIAFPQFGMYDLPGSVTCWEHKERKQHEDAESLGIATDDMPRLGGIVNEYLHLSDVVLNKETPRSTLSNTLQTQQIREWIDQQDEGLSQTTL